MEALRCRHRPAPPDRRGMNGMEQILYQNRYRLRYSVLLASELTFPIRASEDLPDWIFGSDIRKAAESRANGDAALTEALSGLRFSFAYIEKAGTRCLPSPISFAYVRGDASQLRDRLARTEADGPFERVHYLPHCYVADPDSEVVRTVSVRQEVFRDRRVLRAGQRFQGFIEGGKEILERIACILDGNTVMAGGEVHICPLTIGGAASDGEYAADITVRAVSPVLFRRPDGLYDESPAPVLRALSEILGKPEAFTLTDQYRETAKLRIAGLPAAYGTAGGSSFRIRCGEAVKLSRIRSCFIGCGTADGYGEIAAEASRDLYRRKSGKEEDGNT